jgi:hypothetical protein
LLVWFATRNRIFPVRSFSSASTLKFLLDNKRLTAKMWEKVVVSGKAVRVRGTQELNSRSRWKADPKVGKTARIARD